MSKSKSPKTKKFTVPKLKEIYGRKAPDYSRRPKKARGNSRKEHLDEFDKEFDRHVEAINALHLRIADLEKELKAERAEAYYWRVEAELLRTDLVAQLRESAKRKPWPGEELRSDDEDPAVRELVKSLAKDAVRHPEKLGDVGELVKDDDDLLEEP